MLLLATPSLLATKKAGRELLKFDRKELWVFVKAVQFVAAFGESYEENLHSVGERIRGN